MLSVSQKAFMLSVIMLSVIMLSVMAPFFTKYNFEPVHFFFLIGQMSFHGMVRPKEYTPIIRSLEVVAVCPGQEVLMEIDNNILLMVRNPQGIIDKQIKHCPIR